jgi:hypothetical protein
VEGGIDDDLPMAAFFSLFFPPSEFRLAAFLGDSA